MDKKTFISLIERCEAGQATVAEKALLEVYLQRLEACSDAPAPVGQEGAQIWHQLQAQIGQGTYEAPQTQRKKQWWLTAAIIALLLTGAAMWWLLEIKQPVKPMGAIPRNAAGTNNVMLTLADGTTIPLDAANNSALTKQGNTSIITQAKGSLTYAPENNAAALLQYNTLTVPKGTQFQVTLADGSKVWLNAGSWLRYPVAFGGSRAVMASGEAYFEIAPDANRPFEVKVNNTTIQVLGTRFNINTYTAGIISSTLIEGRIAVASGSNRMVLKPGQQALSGEALADILIKNVDATAVIAWKNGLFYFKNAGIREIMEELARWYDITVIYKGSIPDVRFEGEMQRNLPLSTILKQLEQKNVRFELQGKILTIVSE
ncbi:FecR family protein [Chitinophaga nivalis]|uniref:FecR domain-containing protein n=1 Tax=Chitinophaga nivalis TaxID=2991709 RepID=A0ABT3IPJ9_9BACT|nr:FecR family protein [Chitinophaga nivalis]MCW3464410.1 FecR domain-containing protein [Chitinophaga nivalis]MCW3485899.1 FecR domain-containing protein [Chitinophaga nivalis]